MLTDSQRERLKVVLVSPRNPLNIGAAARAMANFGFPHLAVAAPYAPHWQEARSAVGAEDLLEKAHCTQSLAEAVADCTLVIGTGTLTHRKPEQRVVSLPDLTPLISAELTGEKARVALVFGPEKHGLTREDLSWCHLLVEIPTDPKQPSMNLGQATAVCLYELAVREGSAAAIGTGLSRSPVTSERLDLLANVLAETLAAADYSPATMRPSNLHDLRLLLRRIVLSELDARRMLGAFRRILRQLKRGSRSAASRK